MKTEIGIVRKPGAKLEKIVIEHDFPAQLEQHLLARKIGRSMVRFSRPVEPTQNALQSLATFIQLEQDPVRRTALIEMAMKKTNIDVSSLPKSSPEQLNGGKPQQQQGEQPQGNNIMDNILAAQGASK